MTATALNSAGVKRLYAEITEGRHADGESGHVAFLVSTADVSSGRGDVYVALGLGRALMQLGFGISIVSKDHWYDAKNLTDTVVAMLPDFDVRTLPAGPKAIAWIRNETKRWIGTGLLALYDKVLTSSELSRRAVQPHVTRPVSVLAIGADAQLFGGRQGSRKVDVTTTANHWGSDRDVHKALRLAPENAGIRWYGVSRSKDKLVNRWNKGVVSYFDLPEKYQRTLLVIDDLNHTTKPFGNHNSRLFESLAAGALPIVNTALGLQELGLAEVPVYRSPEELLAQIARLSSTREETAELAARLSKVVLENHTFAHRAQEFVKLIGNLVSHKQPWAMKVGFFPDYRQTNPFQSMLYARAREHAYDIVPVKDPVRWPVPRDAGTDLSGYVLHIHWANPILQSERDPVRAVAKFHKFKESIRDMRQRGGRLVWTIHNVMPHELHHYTLELALYRFLSEEADLIHVMGDDTFAAVRNYYHLPPEKCVVIPHPSYMGVYPDFIDKRTARWRLNLHEHEIVLLCLGGIRPYKGLDALFRAFASLSKHDPRLRLLVSGNPGKTVNLTELNKQIAANNRVTATLEFVPDSELQVWLRAADVAILPYQSILNSGSFHLAATFGLPIVAPRLGEIRSVSDRAYVSAYTPGNDTDLARAIRHAVDTMGSEDSSNAASADAQSFGPREVSDAFFEALQ